MDDGAIRAFSKFPFGDPDSAWVGGKVYPLAKPEERKRFAELLKAVPEAYAAWNDDPLWSIRYFNRTGQSESVPDTTYASEEPSDAFPANRPLESGRFQKRLAKNANDAYALGRLSEIYCWQKDYGTAERFADSLRSTHPGHFRYFLVRGFCEEQRGNFAEANRDYGQATRVAPPLSLTGDIRRHRNERVRGEIR